MLSKWFGASWGAPVCEDDDHVDTPVGAICLRCDEAISAEDRGFLRVHIAEGRATVRPIHLECDVRTIIGGLNHLRHTCSCCGGTDPPDPDYMTKREAALAAYDYWMRHPSY